MFLYFSAHVLVLAASYFADLLCAHALLGGVSLVTWCLEVCTGPAASQT